jgi:signal transduction histidine kinase/ActR/RegA family two-component response regulator
MERYLQKELAELQDKYRQLKNYTENLEQQRDELRRKKLNLEVTRHQLAEKTGLLEIAGRHKSQFLAGLSHELRTPLNSILVLSQLLSENKHRNLTDKQVEFARTIYFAGNTLLDLLNDILDVSKIESGNIELSPENVRITEFCSHLEQMFRPVAQKKGLDFGIEIEPEAPETVFTDPMRLNQILRNLVSNAIKFTEKGSVRLRISKSTRSPHDPTDGTVPGDRILISVTDTGIGIPEDKTEMIFEAFRQADPSTGRKFGGTGLGLTISRSLAILLGGEIHLVSKPGEGSVFTLVLPEKFSKDNIRETGSRLHSLWQTSFPFPEYRTGKAASGHTEEIRCICHEDIREIIREDEKILLIVTDDRSLTGSLREIAEEKGFRCLVTQNGECGLHFAEFYSPKAILLDDVLPDITGSDVLKELKSIETTRNIPVYFISAGKDTTKRTDIDAVGFLSKPVNSNELQDAFQTIEKAIQGTPEFEIHENPPVNSQVREYELTGTHN